MENLNAWLDWIKSISIKQIDLSLDRVKEVLSRLNYSTQSIVIIVAGTNGKGSTVKVLEEIYQESGFSVGAFTSPYLHKYNEQIRINGMSCEDDKICSAFEKIKPLMEDVPLTPFEVGTIAALLIFAEYRLDVIILEVGLGGRLDAVNAIDADVAIVTTIAIDHVEWLGSTREAIGREKAGIFRTNLPAICGDFDPPDSILRYASDIDAPLYCQNQQFGFKENKSSWDWWSNETSLKKLPLPKLLLQNVATALMGVQLLQKTLPVPVQAIHNVLKKVALPGRMEIIPGETLKIFDVSHNPAAVALLADYLVKNPVQGKTYAVFSMLADKDIDGTIEGIEKHIDAWYLAPLQVSRGADKETLQEVFLHKNIKDYRIYENIENAYLEAKATAKKDDRIIIFGSFYTVSKCLNLG